MAFVRVCAVQDLWEGEMESFEVAGRTVLVANVGGKIVACQGRCPHQSVALVEGELEGHVLRCRAHHWQFDIRTGTGVNPARAKLERFPIKIEEHDVFVGEIGDPE